MTAEGSESVAPVEPVASLPPAPAPSAPATVAAVGSAAGVDGGVGGQRRRGGWPKGKPRAGASAKRARPTRRVATVRRAAPAAVTPLAQNAAASLPARADAIEEIPLQTGPAFNVPPPPPPESDEERNARLRRKIGAGAPLMAPYAAGLVQLAVFGAQTFGGVDLAAMEIDYVATSSDGAHVPMRGFATKALERATAEVAAVYVPDGTIDHPLAPAFGTLASVGLAMVVAMVPSFRKKLEEWSNGPGEPSNAAAAA